MESTLRRTWAEIDLDALAHNYQTLRRRTETRFVGVVKADAYGHGSVQVSRVLEELGADYLAVSSLDEAMELAAPLVGEDTVILSLLNGVTSEEHIGQTFGPGKILYCVAQGMDAVREDNRLTYTQAGKLYLGLPEEDYFDRGEKLDAVLEFLQRAGVPAEREPGEILHHIWGKFMLNVGVNQVCMAYGCTYGQVQKPGEARDTMIAAMHEARKVGACQGVLVTQKDLYDYLALLDTMPSDAMPSMAQDALAHRPSEVEAFAGTVLELAKFYGMQAPVNRKLYDTIRETEANW